jgi:predicted transcriptional regulator
MKPCSHRRETRIVSATSPIVERRSVELSTTRRGLNCSTMARLSADLQRRANGIARKISRSTYTRRHVSQRLASGDRARPVSLASAWREMAATGRLCEPSQMKTPPNESGGGKTAPAPTVRPAPARHRAARGDWHDESEFRNLCRLGPVAQAGARTTVRDLTIGGVIRRRQRRSR